MNFEIVDNGLYSDYDYLNDVINETLEHEDALNSSFSVIFVSDEEIREINKNYRGIDKVTDVISFAFEDSADIELPIRMLGEIYVSIPRMKEQAREYQHSEKRELSFLVCHGLLHLLGYDHTKSKEEEIRQFSLQDLILDGLGIVR